MTLQNKDAVAVGATAPKNESNSEPSNKPNLSREPVPGFDYLSDKGVQLSPTGRPVYPAPPAATKQGWIDTPEG
jgi:hypothetical protein